MSYLKLGKSLGNSLNTERIKCWNILLLMIWGKHNVYKPLVRHSQLKCHMQTAWIRMRRRLTLRLTRIQAV